MSRVYNEDFAQGHEAGFFMPRSISSSSEAMEGTWSSGRSLPQIHESLDTTSEQDSRRSSSLSAHSFSTAESPFISSGADSLSTSTPEQFRTGKVFGRQENIPPSRAPSGRRQSLSSGPGSRSVPALNLKRSTSLLGRQEHRGVWDEVTGEFQNRYVRNFGPGAMSERQRALTVKRARKMAQVCVARSDWIYLIVAVIPVVWPGASV
ncbi:hypothetical protein B0H15DRAFT_319916 [Mycena belliarum]|uniref:Uncharacterized protein n=1 Tax=Mycena belliarum TaxID=1033014 RepID=A0AAD6UMW7_9AGAR|nr:hypothetical protein B0H15DRAFT_319916 [Mycena belliae]